MAKKEEITYEEDDQGRLVRVQKVRGEPRERHEVVREWNGLIGQEKNLVDELKLCRERLAALKPVKERIENDLEQEACDACDEYEDKDGDRIPAEVIDWANNRRKERGEKELSPKSKTEPKTTSALPPDDKSEPIVDLEL